MDQENENRPADDCGRPAWWLTISSQVILKLSKPAGVEQEILTVRAAIKRLAEEHRDENLLVLVGSIENAWQIAAACPGIRRVSIGAVRQHRGSRACSPHIYLDDEELEWCKNMIQSGIQLECPGMDTTIPSSI